MLIKKGQSRIPLPERVARFTVDMHLYSNGSPEKNPGGYWINLQQIDFIEWIQLPFREQIIKDRMPESYAVHPSGDEIVLYPTNEIEREVTIRYCPAMKQI